MRSVERISWGLGFRPLGDWTVFPWVWVEGRDWMFTWLFIFISREVDVLDEVGEEM